MTISNCEFRIAECATSLISVIAKHRAPSRRQVVYAEFQLQMVEWKAPWPSGERLVRRRVVCGSPS